MSPWDVHTRRVWPIYTGIVIVVIAVIVGGLLMIGALDGGDGHPGPRPTPGARPLSSPSPTTGESADAAATPSAIPRSVLKVVSWGTVSGQLAVVVRNGSSRPVASMRVRITALDRTGHTVLSTTGTPRDVCCTVVGLPPDSEFGLFVDVSPVVARQVAYVEVAPAATVWARGTHGARAVATHAHLERYPDDTVVQARLVARGRGLSGYVAAQAVLLRAGRVVQVVSGRFYCLRPGVPRQIRLHLFHAVPGDVRLDRVLAYPIPAGVPTHVSRRC